MNVATPAERPVPPPLAQVAQVLIEVVTLTLAMLAPWAIGAIEAGWELWLYVGISVLMVLWAVRMLAEDTVSWAPCAATLCLGGLLLLSLFQCQVLPRPIVALLSPATARLNSELLPEKPEVLPFGEPRGAVPTPAGSTLSIYPGATRTGAVRVLAVFLLFAVLRNNLTSPDTLFRLAVLATINGFLLALFAFVEHFSSPPNTVYWSILIEGTPFGPFGCKNHYPYYVNMCIGFGVGILLYLRQPTVKKAHRSHHHSSSHRSEPHRSESHRSESHRSDSHRRVKRSSKPRDIPRLLEDPAALWTCAALALMVCSVAFSMSRGGVISLVGAFVVCLLVGPRGLARLSRLEGGLLVAALASALFVWFGPETVKARLSSLWTGDALGDIRLPLWYDGVVAGLRFPLCGSGLGTFMHADLAFRTRLELASLAADHAHNDYVEAWTEGGLVRLVLSVAFIGFVSWYALRALARFKHQPTSGLLQGAIFAFAAVVLHSVFDFGIHVPAIAFLATVVAALLCALGDPPIHEQAPGTFRGRLAALGVLLGAAAVGGVLCYEGWRQARAESLEMKARAIASTGRADLEDTYLGMLEAATQTVPERAELHLVTGQSYLDVYDNKLAALRYAQAVEAAATTVLVYAPDTGHRATQAAFASFDPDLPASADEVMPGSPQEALARRYLVPGLRHFLQARDLCPLIAKANMRLAASHDWLEQADPREAYLERAKRMYPVSPEVWYLAGVFELEEEDEPLALRSWQQSLTLSQQYLGAILKRLKKRTADIPENVLQQVLPEDPAVLLAATAQLYPDPGDARRIPLLRRGLRVLQSRGEDLGAGDLHLQARLEQELGEDQKAVALYAAALRRDSGQVAWRFERAKLLRKLGRFKEASLELRFVLDSEPGNKAAMELLERVARDLAEGN